jgi:hypothetical protein
MSKESIFKDEWRECLRAHYMDVIRRDDQRTLKSLVRVMHDTGFGDDELAELRVRATMRMEDVPDDFVPDMHVFQVNADIAASPDIAPQPDDEPLEPSYTDDEIVDVVHDELLEHSEPTVEEFQEDVPEEREAEKEDPDAPEQLSLF